MKAIIIVNAVLACLLLVVTGITVHTELPANLFHHPWLLNFMPVALIALIAVSNVIMFAKMQKETDANIRYLTKRIAELEEKLKCANY